MNKSLENVFSNTINLLSGKASTTKKMSRYLLSPSSAPGQTPEATNFHAGLPAEFNSFWRKNALTIISLVFNHLLRKIKPFQFPHAQSQIFRIYSWFTFSPNTSKTHPCFTLRSLSRCNWAAYINKIARTLNRQQFHLYKSIGKFETARLVVNLFLFLVQRGATSLNYVRYYFNCAAGTSDVVRKYCVMRP